ncbi:MAG TPA: 2-phospho-L-lactate guanylyltransferase [Mycobacteriales bacterium]
MTAWAVVVPVKELAVAKTRLDVPGREALALAMAADVVRAARACEAVAGVVVVTNDLRAAAALEPLGARVVADVSDAGLNPALRDGARFARSLWPRHGVAALASDVPCVTPSALAGALGEAAAYAVAVHADARGDGTTLLTASFGHELEPRYGPHSRHAHVAAGAHALAVRPELARDVDTPDDLAAAVALGVGPATRAALDSAR